MRTGECSLVVIAAIETLERTVSGRDCGKGIVDVLRREVRQRLSFGSDCPSVRINTLEGSGHSTAVHEEEGFLLDCDVDSSEGVVRRVDRHRRGLRYSSSSMVVRANMTRLLEAREDTGPDISGEGEVSSCSPPFCGWREPFPSANAREHVWRFQNGRSRAP